MTLPSLMDYSLPALRERLSHDGIEPYRAEQLAGWLYRRGTDDLEAMTDLGVALRSRLAATWATRVLEIDGIARSSDGTTRALLRARDGARIETVAIPEPGRLTLCLSTQVGCGMACEFCATGTLGFRRNLSTGEIVDQLCRMREVLGEGSRITNVVFMGMGEPLLNWGNLSEAIRLLIDPKAFALAPRRVTVSTVGVVPKIEPLLALAPVNLAVSLHAATDDVRDRLVPLNRRFPLAQLLGALRASERVNRRRPVFFEYTLIAGVNDSLEQARLLEPLLRGIPAKLNLIPMNRHPASPLAPPDAAAIDAFFRAVSESGLRATLRRSRGDDIAAACGQLALRAA